MPTVDTTTWINAPLDKVYAIAKDNESFPDFMSDVKSLTIVEREGNRIVSDWVGLIPQFMMKVRWRQEDVWDDTQRTCVFRQVKGDYDKLEGTWTFLEENGGTRFNSTVEYIYNVPTLGALIAKVIHGIVIKNLEGVMEAIKGQSEKP